jgi:hypothetical protein
MPVRAAATFWKCPEQIMITAPDLPPPNFTRGQRAPLHQRRDAMFLRYWSTPSAFIGDAIGALCLGGAAYGLIFAAAILGG